MRIVEQSATRLVLKDRTLWISAVCFAMAAAIAYMALSQDQKAGAYVCAALFLMFGLAFLHSTDLVMDRAQGSIRLNRLSVFRRIRREFRFEDVTDVRVEVAAMQDRRTAPSCRLALITHEAVVPLSASYQAAPERYEAMRAAMLQWLGVTGALETDLVEQMVRQGRVIDAIALLRQREKLDLATAKGRVEEMRRRLQGS